MLFKRKSPGKRFGAISADSVLQVLRQSTCLDLRGLAAQLGVDAANATLRMVIGTLERNRKIRRLGGRGRHAVFVLATFEG